MELEVARMLLNKQKNEKVIAELSFQLERRRRKREKKMAKRVSAAVFLIPILTVLHDNCC